MKCLKQWVEGGGLGALAWVRWGGAMAMMTTACAPDIPSNAAPGPSVVVEFDPGADVPLVPVPNDLALDAKTGKIVIPDNPEDSAAQTEFNQDYLAHLNGFPFESVASVSISGALASDSVNAGSVLALDTATGDPVEISPSLVGHTIVVPPPEGGWLRGHRYAIALIAGSDGLRGADDEPVLGSETWALVSSADPLVSCKDLKTDCRLLVDVIPSSLTDPRRRLADQTTKAIDLEKLRRGYASILDTLDAQGFARHDIPLVWTFTIVDAGEVTFDPGSRVIPFPNDTVRTGPTSPTTGQATVLLPNPQTGKPPTADDCAGDDPIVLLTCGLNTLDGFSTLAPLISENSDLLGAVIQADIAPSSLTQQTVGLARLTSSGPPALTTPPQWTPCLNCTSSPATGDDAQPSPQQLQWRLDAPLDEKTTYAGFVTTGVKDDTGVGVIPNPTFALLRSTAPLVDEDGKSTVNVLSDDQANQLEPLRLAFSPMFDALEAAGVPRTALALAFPFTTQSESTLLDGLHAYPRQPELADIPDAPIFLVDATAQYNATLDAAGVPRQAIGNIYAGAFLSPVAVTGRGGTFDLARPVPEPVPFVIALPKRAAEGGAGASAGVTIFGHGFTRWRNDFAGIANTVTATGQAVIASDVLFHGDRSSCTGSKVATAAASDDDSCADATRMKCDEGVLLGLCVLSNDAQRTACEKGPSGDAVCAAEGQGRCATDGRCQGQGADLLRDDTGRPVISGWNMSSLSNFFATRDNFRQQVIDLSKLVQLLKSQRPNSLVEQLATFDAGNVLDSSNINYIGQGLGGILGALFNAASPDTTNVVLNAAGTRLPQVILDAPAFGDQRDALVASLAEQGITSGTPAFDQFINTAQWILDGADPANVAYRLTHPVDTGQHGSPNGSAPNGSSSNGSAPNPDRTLFLQFIEGDQTVPNLENLALVAAANRSFSDTPPSFGCQPPLTCYEFTEAGDDFDAETATPQTRHGFLLAPPAGSSGPALTTKAQTQVAQFLVSGGLP